MVGSVIGFHQMLHEGIFRALRAFTKIKVLESELYVALEPLSEKVSRAAWALTIINIKVQAFSAFVNLLRVHLAAPSIGTRLDNLTGITWAKFFFTF